MPLLRRRSVFAAKVEATIGTAESLTAAEGVFNAMNVSIQPNITLDEREGQGGFNYLPGVPGIRSGTATFTTELSFDGADLPTWASVLLPACGWVASGQVFSPKSVGPGSDVKTLTIGAYVDGMYRVLSGCMGTFVVNLPTGRAATIDWTFQGKWTNPTDVAIISPTYPTTLPRRFAEGSLAFNSVNLCVSSTTIDAGNEVILRECAGDITGIKSALITNRKPTITADPEMVLAASQDRHGLWLTPSPEALVATIGTAGTGLVVFTAAEAQLENIQQGERTGLLTDNLTWTATKASTADTELTITFTDAV